MGFNFEKIKKLKVEKFLCCLPLEIGAKVIGWLNLIGSVIFLLASFYFMAWLAIVGCATVRRSLLSQSQFHDVFRGFMAAIDCSHSTGVIIGTLLVVVVCIGCLGIFSWLLIQGTKTRDPGRLKPMLVLLVIIFLFGVIEVVTFQRFFSAIRDLIVTGYSIIIVYSLHERFHEEREGLSTVQYLEPGSKV